MEQTFPFTWDDVEKYKRRRERGREFLQRIVETVPRTALNEIGKSLGIMRHGVLLFDTEDVVCVLMDCCLFDWIEGGRNVIEKYADAHPMTAGTDEYDLLQAYRAARFRILAPGVVVPGAGFHAVDVLSDSPLFVMDVAFSQSLQQGRVLLASRTAPLDGYWMTTGAALPIDRPTSDVVMRRLEEGGWLEGGTATGSHTMALAVIRACLDCGAAEHVRYEGPQQEEELPAERSRPAPATSRRVVGRNERCPCGSGKKYKLCCLRK